jgi:pSer/pThr/pTyr-binding forkhead associated (FHA) protein
MADIPVLVCTRGKLAGERFVATETRGLKLGRADDNDVVIQDDGVSRFHAELLYTNGSLWLRDAGSRNGVFVNGNRVVGHQALKVGDDITVAEHGFSVQWDGAEQTEERPAPKRAAEPEPDTGPKPTKRRWFWPFS